MEVRVLVLGLILGFFSEHISHKSEALTFKFTNVYCESHDESRVIMHVCRLKAINRNLTVLNINATIVYPVYDITLDMQLFKKANGYKPFLVRNFVDVCQFLKKKRTKSFFNIVYNLVNPLSNLNHSCPYAGYILIKDLYIMPKEIGLPMPTGEYLISLKWLYDKKLQITSNFYFTFTEDYIDM